MNTGRMVVGLLILALGLCTVSQADEEVTIVARLGWHDPVPDLGEWKGSWAYTEAPAGARVKAVKYLFEVDVASNANCSDYEIGISSTDRGGTSNYLLVWDNAGGKTDMGLDDDAANDTDIELGQWRLTAPESQYRTTPAFNGQRVNQTWYVRVKDTVAGGNRAEVSMVVIRVVYEVPGAQRPSVTTEAPDVTYSPTWDAWWCTLRGRIANDGGAACRVRFRYRKQGGTYQYSDWRPSPSYEPSYVTGDRFSHSIQGSLDPDTTYYCSAQAKNSAGESAWGNEVSFTTTATTVQRPQVETRAATAITETTATINGRITNDGGEACQYRFRVKEEGGTYLYGSWTGSKRSGESFSGSVTGLDPGTKYYFATQARNSAGEGSWGNELSFTTSGGTPTVTTEPATAITASTATLNGRIVTDGGEACQYRFRFRKEGGTYGYTTYTGSRRAGQSFSHALTGLEPKTKYYYAARARNSSGEGDWGNERSFTTLAPKPEVRTDAATEIAGTRATLNGRITEDGGEACQYRFRYRKEGGTYGYTSWTGSKRKNESFSYPLAGLSLKTKYYFSVQAKNSAGESDWGNELSFTTLGLPKVTTEAATAIGATTATLNGKVADDGGEACQYRFRYRKRGGAYTYTPWTGSQRTGQTFSRWTTELERGTNYSFAAQAKNAAGESAWGNELNFTTLAPKPTVATEPATGIAGTTATLKGKILTDGGVACEYRFRYKKEGGTYTVTAWEGSKRSGEPFGKVVTDLDLRAKYYFAAQAKNVGGESAWGTELSFTTLGRPKVTTEAATAIDATRATLNGTLTDDGGAACQCQFRYKEEGGDYTEMSWADSKQTGETFSRDLTGLAPGTKYYFAARAKNVVGESAWGSEKSFTARAVKPTATTEAVTAIATTSATLNGRVLTDGGAACTYRFRYKKEGGAYTYTLWSRFDTKRTGEAFSHALTGLTPGTKYYCGAQARNSAGESDWGSDLSFDTLSAKPKVTTKAAEDVTATTATLNGTVVEDGGEACEYRFRYKKEGGSYKHTSWTGSKRTSESFSHGITGLDRNSKYYFAAQVKNPVGESAWGSELSFTTLAPKPKVETEAAEDIAVTEATVNGKIVDDGAEACEYRFRYKKAGGSYTQTAWTGSKQTGEAFSHRLKGLELGTEYYFAAQGRNSSGESEWGTELSFRTMMRPVVTTQPATRVRATTAFLEGKISDDGGGPCQYRFRYKKEGGSYTETAWTGSERIGQSFSHALAGLDREAKYFFAAQAKNAAGESDWGDELSFTTLAASKPIVSTEAATAITGTKATINGKVFEDGGESCQYRFRHKKEGGFYTQTAWTGSKRNGDLFDHVLSGLELRTKYYFAAQAKNSFGESDWGSEENFTTLGKPIAVTRDAADIAARTATLNGEITDDGGGVCEYQFRYRKEGGSYSETQWAGSLQGAKAGFSEAVSKLAPATKYFFSSRARNGAGEGPWSSDRSLTTLPIKKPVAATLPAINVTAVSATLVGKITDDGNEESAYRFRYTKGARSYKYTSWAGAKKTGESFSQDATFLDPNTTYRFSAQAKNSAGEGAWGAEMDFTTLPGPKITELSSRYCSAGKHRYFLNGVPLVQEFTLKVKWNGMEPDVLEWQTPWKTYRDTCLPGQTEASRFFDVGTDFGVRGKLRVRAISKAPNSMESTWVTANFTVIPPPPGITEQMLTPETNGDLVYKSSTFAVDLFDAGVSQIPDDVDGFGGHPFEVVQKMSVQAVIGNGIGHVLPIWLPSAGISVGGGQFEAETQFRLDWFYSDGQWVPVGFLRMSADARYNTPAYYVFFPPWPIPLYYRFAIGLDMNTTMVIVGWIPEVGPEVEGETCIEPYGEGAFGVGIADFLGIEAYLHVGAKMCLDVTEPSQVSRLCVVVEGGVRACFFFICDTLGSLEYEWCWNPKGNELYGLDSSSNLDRILRELSEGECRLMDRDYFGPDYAAWLPSAPRDGRIKMSIAASLDPAIAPVESGGELVLQSKVFSQSQPTIAADDDKLFLAWVYDEPSRSSGNRTEVVFSSWDNGTWAEPEPIDDDGTVDFSPQLAVLPNGQALCAWENANRQLPDDVDMTGIAAALEIAVASYDAATGVWSAQTLTSDSHMDRTPRIAAADNNTAMVVWVYNDKDDVLGQDSTALNTIRYSLWNGDTWSQPDTAAAGIGCMIKTTLAYDGTRALYVYTLDTDWDWATDTDRELYALSYDGVQWSSPVRLTDDALLDANPQVVYDQGDPLLVWYRDGHLVSCRNLKADDPTPAVLASGGAMDFRLAKSPTGRISLIWTDASSEAAGMDIFVANYDPTLGLWSTPYPLTSDRDMEKALTATYVGPDELALAYNKARVGPDTRGVPEIHQTDLCVLRHDFGRDLAVYSKDILVSQANPRPGDVVEITALIRNVGDVPEVDVPVAFYHGDPVEDGQMIGDMQTISGPIPAAGTASASVFWTIPEANSPQQIYVAAFVAEASLTVLPERDWANNIAHISLMAPDLTVESASVEKTGHKARVITAKIANVGVVPALNVEVTIRTDSPEGTDVGHVRIPVIDPNSRQEVRFDWDIAAVDSNSPEIALYVLADADNTVQEENENNNTGLCLVHVSKRGDITDDGSVDGIDLSALVESWLDTASSPDWRADCDLDRDGRVDLGDLAILSRDWGWEAAWHNE